MVETFYIHLEFKTKKGGWSINLPFVCNKCGVCCTLDDFLTAGEIKTNQESPRMRTKIQTLYDELGEIWEKDEAKYNDYIMHTPCPFLINKTCSIYEIRPEGCRRYPNTEFGMETQDCEPLFRFKKQRATLKKGRKTTETYHFMTQEENVKHSMLTEKQYQNCLAKLRQTDITKDEILLLETINKEKKRTA